MRLRLALAPVLIALGLLGWLWAGPQASAILPVVSIEAASSSVGENSPATPAFVVRRAGPTSEPLTVSYWVSGVARNGQDYTRLPGVVTIPAGTNSALVQLQPTDDAEAEGPETVTLTLVSNTHPFTLVILPDTQYYIGAEHGGIPLMFDRQTQWIVDHKDDHHIAFVLHEGDLTEDNALDEWPLAQTIMGRLDGLVPYAIALGNHDGLDTAVGQTALFNQFFPLARYQGLPTFGGVFEANRMDNSYHCFTAGGVDWLVVSLEYGPRDTALAWANQVVTNHPQRRVIVLTHDYLYYDDTLHGTVSSQRWLPTSDGRSNNGIDVWNKFVRHHANISLVFCGHAAGDGIGRLVSTGDHGNKVYQLLANYQSYTNGGSGWMRLLEFLPGQDSFTVHTYSPYLGCFWADSENEFAYDHLGIFSPTNQTYVVDESRASATVALADNETAAWLADSFGTADMRLWTVVDEGAWGGPSSWEITGGRLRQSSSIYGPNGGALSNRQGTYVFWNNPTAFTWRDYDFSTVINAADVDGLGVLFRYQNRSNYYKLDLDRRKNFHQLSKTVAGVESVLARETGGYPTNRDFRLRVQVQGRWSLLSLDGLTLFNGAIPDESLAAGSIGLYSWFSSGLAFDNVEVTPPSVVITPPAADGTGQFRCAIIGPPSPAYRLEASTNLADWTPLADLPALSGTSSFTNPLPASSPARQFFRVVVP